MKDLFKRLLCVLMALMMVMALCACGESDDDDDDRGSRRSDKETTEEISEEETTEEETTEAEPSLLGEWETTMDLSEAFGDMVGMDIDHLDIAWWVDFKDDGTYDFAINVEDFLEQLEDILWDVMVQAVAEQAECTEDEAEEALLEEIEAEGMTKDEFMDALMEEQGLTADLFGDATGVGEWELDGNILVLDGDELEIEFNGDDEFEIVDCDGNSDFAELLEEALPVVFERV